MLTRGELDLLDREGYVVATSVLDDAHLARLRRAFDAAPAQARGTQHVEISRETPDRDAWSALEAHPLVACAADFVLRRPHRVRDVHGRNPLPGGGRQGLHSDWPPVAAGAPYEVVTLLWMIDDFTRENGATRVVPGTHRLVRPVPKSLAQPLAHHPDERVVIGRAGSVLVMNGHLWHSGRGNDGDGPRRCAQMVVVGAAT